MTLPRKRTVRSDIAEELQYLKYSEIEKMRLTMLNQQMGMCPICENPCNSPVLDHHHTKRIRGSGKLRGVLCRSCNVFLGKIENNASRYGVSIKNLPSTLKNIAKYLEKPHIPILHPTETPKKKKVKKSSYNIVLKIMSQKFPAVKMPNYPPSGTYTKPLQLVFDKCSIIPEFYK